MKSVSTETEGGKLKDWGGVGDDARYAYIELVDLIPSQPKKLIKLDGDGDKSWKLPMRKSLFAHVPPYVIFHLYSVKMPYGLPAEITNHMQWRCALRFMPQMVRRTVTNSGFNVIRKSEKWMGSWGAPLPVMQIKALKTFQKVNHFPGTIEICRKDRLWKNLSRMMQRFGKSEFNFTPTTYVFPDDKRRFQKFFERNGGIWITKPPSGCAGNGIRVVSRWSDIPKRCPLVVQRYVRPPRLIYGVKFDMRLYALITSVDPLLVYLYSEGLVRFATAKYVDDVHHLYDRFMHLTNTSVNKSSPTFRPNDSIDKCKGNMWSLNSLWAHLASRQRVDVPRLWEKIKDIVVKTIVSAESVIVRSSNAALPSPYNAFQLLGFDVMLDENLRPWLLEVNNYPSMDPDTPLCSIVKGELARDVLNIVGFQIPDTIPDAEVKLLTERYGQSPICHDHRLYATTLTQDEKDKHEKFAVVEVRQDYLESILATLTPDDVRRLIRYEDEATQVGGFEKIFPTRSSHRYHKFFDKLRYYNKLLDAWEETYWPNKAEGLSRLQKLCREKRHLGDLKNQAELQSVL
ncbi:tubulin monoglutamylase TTLL4-like [Neodiprion fabricii]|uniref:tubulin monoglutamylase TTLL4-like n=1 Tax=Neodiprion fabricii TaxID=2872261 RepID=UPI001ED8FB6F|nr:tubulin monoglutamylase TTLL4-like [Neodiprion fabricii]